MQWVRRGDFYDLHVPGWGHYSAAGLWHHNSGKSVVGAFDLLQRALDGRTYMVTGPTYKVLAQATIRTFLEQARRFNRLVRVTRSADNPSALIRPAPPRRGLAEVLFRSTDNPDHLRGPNLSGVWMDEASLSPLEAYQILVARLREKGERGWLSATFTPKGLTHWTYDVFGQSRPGVFLVHARTDQNPFLSPDFVALVKTAYAGVRAEQELAGRFVAVEGAEWPPDYFSDRVLVPACRWPASWKCCALALDPALGEGERGKPPPGGKPPKPGCYAAFTFVGVDTDGALWADAWMSQQWDASALVQLGIDLWRQTGAQALAVEVNGGQAFLAELFKAEAARQKLTLPLYAVNNIEDKEIRIRQTLTPFLAQGRLRFREDSPGAKLLVGQMRDFPVSEFKDGPDSLQMAIVLCDWLLGHKPRGAQPRAVRG